MLLNVYFLAIRLKSEGKPFWQKIGLLLPIMECHKVVGLFLKLSVQFKYQSVFSKYSENGHLIIHREALLAEKC